MNPRAAALQRALELLTMEAAACTGSTVAAIEVDALRRELEAELARVPGAAVHRTWRWPEK